MSWFQGRMEFGPRALGNRSIIADPRSKDMQKNLNLKVKIEKVLGLLLHLFYEKVSEWFDINTESPYMTFVAKVNESKHLKISNEEENLLV